MLYEKNQKTPKNFSLANSPLKSARKLLGFEREDKSQIELPEEMPEYLQVGEFPIVNLENDPIAQLIIEL